MFYLCMAGVLHGDFGIEHVTDTFKFLRGPGGVNRSEEVAVILDYVEPVNISIVKCI